MPVRAEQVVIELLQPGSPRLLAELEARSQPAGNALPFDDGHPPPTLREAQRHGKAESTTAEHGDPGGHGAILPSR